MKLSPVSGDLVAMALRNLARHRVKTVITTTAVAVSVALYIFMDAWLLGMNLESRRNIVAYEAGAAKIQTPAYFVNKDELPMYENFADWEPLASALGAEGYQVAPRFVFTGTLYSRWGSAPMVFNAVDPIREPSVLRYGNFLEAGRLPRPGRLEMAVGTVVADKLRLGLPRRVSEEEFRTDLLMAAQTDEERTFIQSLYTPLPQGKADQETYLALRADSSRADRDRLWGILASSGRMDARVSTTIDIAAAPETIPKDKYEGVLFPALSEGGKEAVSRVYTADPATGDYRLNAEASGGKTAPGDLQRALRAMLDADYPGAVRHVNQLIDAVVVGVVNSPNPKTNGNVGFLPIDALQGEDGLMLGGAVTELLVRKANAVDTTLPGPQESPQAIAAALERRGIDLPSRGLEVHGWKEYAADYLAASAQDNVTSRIMIVLLFVLSFIGIANTMLMAILERTKETGMLRALGMTDRQVVLVYALEAAMIGALGSGAGMILGSLANIPMVAYGIDYSSMAAQMGGDYGYRVTAFFRSAWNPWTIGLSGLVATLLSAVAAVPPTLRALRMPVTESLRFE